MVGRLLLNENKLLVSKAGFDAENPSLQQGDKLFDSDWLFSGTVVEAGVHVDQADYTQNKRQNYGQQLVPWNERTNWQGAQTINFTPLPFIPTVLLLPLSDSRYWGDYNMVLLGADKRNRNFGDEYYRLGEITVTNSAITIPRCYGRAGNWYYREDFIYLIMAM